MEVVPAWLGTLPWYFFHFAVHQHGDAECPVLYSILSFLSLRHFAVAHQSHFQRWSMKSRRVMGLHLLMTDKAGNTVLCHLSVVSRHSSEKAPIKGTACHGLSMGYYTHCAIHVPSVANDFQRMLALAKLKPLKGKSQPFDKQWGWLL